MKDQDVTTQQLKQKYLDFYIRIITKRSNFTEAKTLQFEHKVTEFHAFIWVYYILTEVQQKLAVITAPPCTPEHNLCQGVPVPHADVSLSSSPCDTCRNAHRQPMGLLSLYRCSVVPKTEPLLTVNQPLRCACLLSDPHALAGGLTLHSWVYAMTRMHLL